MLYTNENILELCQGLRKIDNYVGIKFNFFIAKNLKKLEQEEEILLTSIRKVESLLVDFEKERTQKILQYVEMENGSPKISGKNYIIKDDLRNVWIKELEIIKDKHKDNLDKYEEQIKELNNLMKSESFFIPYMIDITEVPENITTHDLKVIFNLIKET